MRSLDLQYPYETVVKLWVHTLQVVECDGFGQQLFIEGQGETSIQVVAVEYSNTDDTTHEVEVGEVLLEWTTYRCYSILQGYRMMHYHVYHV